MEDTSWGVKAVTVPKIVGKGQNGSLLVSMTACSFQAHVVRI